MPPWRPSQKLKASVRPLMSLLPEALDFAELLAVAGARLELSPAAVNVRLTDELTPALPSQTHRRFTI